MVKGPGFVENRTRQLLILSIIVGVLLAACQGDAINPLFADSSVQIDLPADSAPRMYRFQADPLRQTTLHFESNNASMPFSADVSDQAGTTVAHLDSGTLQNATLSVAPGSGHYQVRVVSGGSPTGGSVSVSLTTDNSPVDPIRTTSQRSTGTIPVSYVSASPDVLPAACQISTDYGGGVNIRQNPGLNAPVLGQLLPGSPVSADRRSIDGWYRVRSQNRTGWVLGSVANLSGLCNSLPMEQVAVSESFQPTALPVGGPVVPGVTAPYDIDAYYLGVDRDQGGQFAEAISYPNGDGTDRIHVRVTDLNPLDSRDYAFSLTCAGSGAEFLRWGPVENPVLACDQRLPVFFTADRNQHNLIVTLPGGVGQHYVDYTLHVRPVAPVDLVETAFGVDRDRGGVFGDVISYPDGDRSDRLQMVVSNLETFAPHNHREFSLTLTCAGAGTEFVRWGAPDQPTLTCGSTMQTAQMFGADQQWLAVVLPEGSGQSYVRYRLLVVPAAPADSAEYVFGLDRDTGGQFNETISYPAGDRADAVQLTITNLQEHMPNNFRQLTLTLICEGQGVEQVRWGAPQNPVQGCGGTLTLPFLYNLDGHALIVTLPEDAPQSYVHYRLVATVMQ